MKLKTAVITGSTSGIGLGIATRLAQSRCNIVLNGFGNSEYIEEIKKNLSEQYGVAVLHFDGDVTRPADINSLVDRTVAAFGTVDILVNNAGIQHVSPIVDFPEEQWDRIIAINLSAAFHSTKACLPHMTKSGWGRIVNVASAHGLVASIDKSAYVASKHGLIGLTKVIALETANTGVTANAICPGWVSTPLVEAQIEVKAMAESISRENAAMSLLATKQPLHRFSTPEQIGDLVVYLTSDAASTITGASISIDGGWTAQ